MSENTACLAKIFSPLLCIHIGPRVPQNNIKTTEHITVKQREGSNSLQSRTTLVLYDLALHTLLFAIIYAYHACVLMQSL